MSDTIKYPIICNCPDLILQKTTGYFFNIQEEQIWTLLHALLQGVQFTHFSCSQHVKTIAITVQSVLTVTYSGVLFNIRITGGSSSHASLSVKIRSCISSSLKLSKVGEAASYPPTVPS